MSHGRGHIVKSTAEEVLGQEKINTLRSQGHIGFVSGPHSKVLILPKVPEFLAAAGSSVIADKCLSSYREEGAEKAYKALVQESDYFPYGDVVGARALVEISRTNGDLANLLSTKLLGDEPKEHQFMEGSRALMYFEDLGEINIYFGKGTKETSTGNIQPWNILSHLCSFVISTYEEPLGPQLVILATIGSYPRILIRPYVVPAKETPQFIVHEISDYGTVLCHQSGIVEPITYAMQLGFYRMPNSMLRLCHFANKNKLFFLAHRLNMAAISTESCTEEEVALASVNARKILRPFLRNMLEIGHEIGRRRKDKSHKVGRNAPCPCGSGKKYKKCCGR